ncbi:MAG TPA: chemotaxis protein CheA [Acidobacteriota bacterium]|nr:chemotaxis protein CheA [Acidobacteriota bacterium]
MSQDRESGDSAQDVTTGQAILEDEEDRLWAEALKAEEKCANLSENRAPCPAELSAETQELPEEADQDLMVEFIGESGEAIDAAEAALLDLETDPKDKEAVNTVFRSFHTIKGTSAFLGLDRVSHLAHLAENLFHRIREGKVPCAGGFADLALRSVDVLKELLQNVQAGLEVGGPIPLPGDFKALCTILQDPEASGITSDVDESSAAPPARLGDILVRLGAVSREDVEKVEATRGDEPLGIALVRSRKAKASDVAKALRSQRKSQAKDASVRVPTDRLDRMIDLVGELVIAHSMVAQDQIVLDQTHHRLARKVNQASKIVRELQDLSLSVRMVPLEPTFHKLARLVRDLSRKEGKPIEFITVGENTEIDRSMVDVIGDPLVHMVRNACDHGLESPQEREAAGKDPAGTVALSARQAGGNVIVELRDDGRGLDRQKIARKALSQGLIDSTDDLSEGHILELIFAPGFSTAEEVTDVSGRGVGMDVVRRNIESIRGRVQVESKPGRGSTFTIVLPLTLAITDGMLIRVGQERFIIPITDIHMSFRPPKETLSTVHGCGEMVLLRGEFTPLHRLDRLLGVPGAQQDPCDAILVMVGEGDNRSALMVDDLLGQQQVVAKPLGKGFGSVRGISGGAVLGDGRVGLILDTADLVELARNRPSSWDTGRADAAGERRQPITEKHR